MEIKRSGVARYESVDESYLEQRQLKPSAGWILLWAMGVGAVISGDYSGWNVGLQQGGFGGLAIGTLLMATMYACMVFSIAELAAALPHAGGFFSFTRNAFGPTGGFICGWTDTIEYVVTPSVIVYYIAEYVQILMRFTETWLEVDPFLSQQPTWIWWIVFYAVFVGINILGVAITLRVGLCVTAIAVLVLLIFYGSVLATGSFRWENLTNIPVEADDGSRWLPFGWKGVFACLPFAIWFYLAIEQLPLAAEESRDAVRDMPRALIWGIVTLLILSLLTLVLNTGVAGGARVIAESDAPLAVGFESLFEEGGIPVVMTLVSLAGMIASFHAIIYAYGRVLFALSRAGYIPRWISLTGHARTPWVALIVGAAIGLACLFAIEFFSDDAVAAGGVLLNMAVFGAVLSYAMVMASYVKLRITRPDLPRPYRSPLGVPGAVVGGLLSLLALAATFADPGYRTSIWGVVLFVIVGLVYFFVYSRTRLVAQAPEEEQALITEAEKELDATAEG